MLQKKNGNLSWDVQAIQSETDASDNVVAIVRIRMARLSPHAQRTLVVAACLGFRFQRSLLSQIMVHDTRMDGSTLASMLSESEHEASFNPVVEDAIRIGCEHNLIEKANNEEIKFTHDQIQQALLSLLAKDEKQGIHYLIGQYVLDACKKESLSDFQLFLAVDQLNYIIETTNEKEVLINLCNLNQDAAHRAMSNFAFHQGADFFRNATRIATRLDLWNTNYCRALELYSSAVECTVHAGRFYDSEIMANEVIQRGRSIDDKLRVYEASIDCLTSQNKFKESIDLGLSVLKEVGEIVPRQPSMPNVARELSRVFWMVRGKSDDDLLNMTPLFDTRKRAAMNLMKRLCLASFISLENELFSLLCLRTMSLSLRHGLCGASAFGFAAYGMVLCLFKHFNSGYRFGQMAQEIIRRHGTDVDVALPTLVVACFLKHKKEDMRSQRKALAHATAISLQLNEMSIAPATAFLSLEVSFCIGCPLEEVQCEGLASLKLVGQHSNKVFLSTVFRILQSVANLRDPTCDPLVLTGDFMNEDTVTSGSALTAIFAMYTNKLFMAFIFQNWEMVVDIHSILKSYKDVYCQRAIYFASDSMLAQVGIAYCGLAGISRKSKRVYRRKARHYLSKLNQTVLNGSADAAPGAKFLDAEYASLNENNPLPVARVYDMAIDACLEHQFIHYAGFACERAATVFRQRGDLQKARTYLEQARMHYTTWNATTKIAQIEALLN